MYAISRKAEDYLEAILNASSEKGYARTRDIARELCLANQAHLSYVPVPAGGACFRIRLAGVRAIGTGVP